MNVRSSLLCLSALFALSACDVDTGGESEEDSGANTPREPGDNGDRDGGSVPNPPPSNPGGNGDNDAGPGPGPGPNPPPSGGNTPPVGDNLSCAEITQCFQDCPSPDDQACVGACVEAGSAEGQQALSAIYTCLEANNNDESRCQAEIEACVGAAPPPPPPGDLSCAEINACFGECGENDQDCLRACVENGTPEAQQTLQAVYACLDANNNDQSLCQTEIEACIGAPPPPGTDTCSVVLDCVVMAMTQADAQACYAGGSEAARSLFESFATCFEDNMCMAVPCDACNAEFDACQADN
jgi:hypothetical protein